MSSPSNTKQLRNVSPDELQQILKDHKLWIESDGKDGKRADLSNTNLSRANLSNANLTKANLSSANLSSAKLTDADLSSAELSYANLTGADLTNANLSYADLTSANLSYANLTKANLSCADLSCADLSCANLSKANLIGAIVSLPWKIVNGKLVTDSRRIPSDSGQYHASSPQGTDSTADDSKSNPFTVFNQICDLFQQIPVELRQGAIDALRSKFPTA